MASKADRTFKTLSPRHFDILRARALDKAYREARLSPRCGTRQRRRDLSGRCVREPAGSMFFRDAEEIRRAAREECKVDGRARGSPTEVGNGEEPSSG